MTAPSVPVQSSGSVAQLLEASAVVKQYLRRVPPHCRTSGLAALAELERLIRDMRSPSAQPR